ncbi:MAG: hypothetical protein R3F30_06525 [Planctomycetota bacterium]
MTFTNATTRTQQIDSNLIGGKLALIRGMAFRRNNGAQSTAIARKLDLQVDFGYGASTITTTFDNNYASGTRKTVHAKKTVSLPDWTQTISKPEPFDLVIKLDTPFAYNNKLSLVWDVIVTNNAGGGSYSMDWFSTVPTVTYGEKEVVLGTGCKTATGTFAHTTAYTADTANLNLGYSGTGGPASAPAIAIVGATDLALTVGLCTKLHGDLTFLWPIGTTDTTGSVTQSFPLPWNDAFAGVALVSQLLAVDTTQPVLPVALSNGIRATTPFVIGGGATTAFKIDRIYNQTSTGPTGTLAKSCAPVLFSL